MNQAKKNFEEQLARYNHDALYSGSLLKPAKQRKNNIVIKGRQFLKSICELNFLTGPLTETFYANILSDATIYLQNSSRKNYSLLSEKVNRLEQMWKDENLIYKPTGLSIAFKSLYATTGVALVVTGTMGIIKAITALSVGLALIMSPWGLLALGLGFAVLGGVLAVISAYQVYINYRASNETQLKEITDFIDFINPDLKTLNEEQIDLVNDSIYALNSY